MGKNPQQGFDKGGGDGQGHVTNNMALRVLLGEKDPQLLGQEGVTHLATGEHAGELHEELQIWEVGRCRRGPRVYLLAPKAHCTCSSSSILLRAVSAWGRHHCRLPVQGTFLIMHV